MVDGGAGATEQTADLELVRVCVAPEGCFGVLCIDGVPVGPVSLERTYPLVENLPRGAQFVKIPPGRYRCVRTTFHRGGYESFEITGVVGHSRLVFHIANEEGELDGCVGVGLRFSPYGPGILDSRRGFELFMSLVHGRPFFDLVVRVVA